MSGDLIVAIATLILSTIVILVTGTWRLGIVRDELKDAINANRIELEKKINEETDTIRKEFGETVSALKEKLTQVELYIRDNYVTKNSFNTVLERILAEIRTLSEKLDSHRLRVDAEIKSFLRDQDP